MSASLLSLWSDHSTRLLFACSRLVIHHLTALCSCLIPSMLRHQATLPCRWNLFSEVHSKLLPLLPSGVCSNGTLLRQRPRWLTQMYRTDFWTLWEKARVGCFKRTTLKHDYLGWNRSPAQVGCIRQVLRAGALGRPRGIGWKGRWAGGSDGEHMYIHGWFMSMFDKNHYNIVK